MTKIQNHYDTLKVARDAPPSVIKAAYRALSQQWHPDKSTSPESQNIMVAINSAYAVLSDPDKRRVYDASILDQETIAKREADAARAAAAKSQEQAQAQGQGKQSRPQGDEPVWSDWMHSTAQSRNRRTGIPARLWIVVALSLSYLAWVRSDALFATDQPAEIAVQIPPKDVGIGTTSLSPTDTAELPLETTKPPAEAARRRVVQAIPESVPKHAFVDNGSADEDRITPVESTEAKTSHDASPVELAEPATQRYVVQVASLATQEKVNELQGRLRSAGVSSFTEKSGELIRVRTGPYKRDESEKVRSKLISMGLSGTMVPISWP